jgi:hypothetical protein
MPAAAVGTPPPPPPPAPEASPAPAAIGTPTAANSDSAQKKRGTAGLRIDLNMPGNSAGETPGLQIK